MNSIIRSKNYYKCHLTMKQAAIESMEYHRSIAVQLVEPSQRLKDFISDPGLATKFLERSLQLQQLIGDAKASQRRLALSSEHWHQFLGQSRQVHQWLQHATSQLQELLAKAQRERLGQDDCFQYWVRSS